MATSASKRSDTIVVNELLAFVQNKLDVMDELSLEQICTSSYTEADVNAAKVVLRDTAKTTVRLALRRKEGSGKRDLLDIFRVFKETDPDDVPTYVAKDLNKLPPVTFDHVDVTRLLKDIVLLRSDITEIRGKLEASERNSAQLRSELTSLRIVCATPAVSPTLARNVSPRRGASVQHDTSTLSTARTATNIEQLRVSDPATQPVRVVTTPPRPTPPAPAPSGTPAPKQVQRDSYAQVSRRPRRRPLPVTAQPRTVMAQPAAPAPAPLNVVADKDGFTLAQNRKSRQRRNRNKRGTVPAASTNLQAAAPTTLIYLSRLDVKTTPEDIWRHMREMRQGRIEGQVEVEMTLLESNSSKNFRSYRLRVPAKHQAVFLSSDFWPEGVVFRRFREAKK